MNTENEKAQNNSGLPKGINRIAGITLVMLGVILVLGWGIWEALYGLRGVYAHVYYIPVPTNLTSDVISTPLQIDGSRRRARIYTVTQSMNDIVVFHQDQLPKTGWIIEKEGNVTLSRGEIAYCFIAKQHNVPVYILIRQSPEGNSSKVFIDYLDKPNTPRCDYDQFD